MPAVWGVAVPASAAAAAAAAPAPVNTPSLPTGVCAKLQWHLGGRDEAERVQEPAERRRGALDSTLTSMPTNAAPLSLPERRRGRVMCCPAAPLSLAQPDEKKLVG